MATGSPDNRNNSTMSSDTGGKPVEMRPKKKYTEQKPSSDARSRWKRYESTHTRNGHTS